MMSLQKTIKFFAIALALCLIVSITTGIIQGISYFYNDDYVLEDSKTFTIGSDIKIIDVSLKNTSLTIKNSDAFKVETNNKYIILKEDSNKLTIKEKNKQIINNKIADLIIYLPNTNYNEVKIKMGAGKMNVDSLFTDSASFNLGAGETKLVNLKVNNNLKLDGGAGMISIKNSNINDLDLNLGIGEVSISGEITGISKIDCGIGSVNLNLFGKEDDYKLKVSKGIGNILINDNKVNGDTTLGNGNNIINIDGGVGEVKIYFK